MRSVSIRRTTTLLVLFVALSGPAILAADRSPKRDPGFMPRFISWVQQVAHTFGEVVIPPG